MKDGLCPDFPFVVNDYLSSTKRKMLTLEEQGAYILLLCHAWNDPDCCLLDDDISLASVSEMGKKWLKSGPKIRRCFELHPARAGYIYNVRQWNERIKQNKRIDESKTKAKNAANARWRNHARSNAQALHEHRPSIGQASFKHMLADASSPVTRLPSTQDKSTETSSLVPDGTSKDEIPFAILAYWNTKGQLQKARSMAGKRLKIARARLKEAFFALNWQPAIDRIAISSFCTGKVPTATHPNGWPADIDWFLRPGKIEQIIEGKYDDRNPVNGAETEHDPDKF